MVEEHGMVFIGPSPEHIAMMGDKVVAKQTAQGLGIPVVPGSDGAVTSAETARSTADAIGYPVLIKARSEEHTSELQSLMRISYAVFCLKKKKHNNKHQN